MKLGYDAKRAFRNYTGLGNYSRTLLQGLLHHYPDSEYFLYTPAASQNPRMAPILENPNVFTRTPQGLTRGGIWRSWAMTRDLKADEIDVYHGLSHELPRGIRDTGIPAVVTIHDLIFLRYPEFYPTIDRYIYNRKFRHGCEKADKVVAISQHTKNDIVHYYNTDPTKIEVVYQACDPMFYNPSPEPEQQATRGKYDLPENFLLYVGSVIERKNLLGIVQAMFRMHEDIPLVVIGKGGSYLQRVKEYAIEARLEHRIIYLEEVPFKDFPAIYTMATALVFPSFFEGFGIPVLESLHCQTPVIGSKNTCLEEAGGPDQIYVDPGDVNELAEAMDRATTDTEWQRLAARTGSDYVSRFHAKNLAPQLMDIYKSLV